MWVIGHAGHLAFAFATLLLSAPSGRATAPGLVFSVRTWVGEYASKVVPGGVESTPTVGAIYTVNADGTGLARVVPPGAGIDCPVPSRDGRWVYYQAGERTKTQIYRCRPDGTGVTSLTPPAEHTKRLKGDDRVTVKEAFGYSPSADGTRMVFTAHDGAAGRVVISDTDGSNPTFVAPGLGYTYMARLGPKNDRVRSPAPPGATESCSPIYRTESRSNSRPTTPSASSRSSPRTAGRSCSSAATGTCTGWTPTGRT